ncbi:MAG: iron-containing alcohol dehydrogenase [Deltaproteobacteria bacterium]|jgi:alcohol dehydrogenase|nr:iron-containing alcohol dehydrogenase [Deltaproteobacteria bacterium]
MEPVFAFQGAKKILFGCGAVENLAEEVKALAGQKALLVVDQGLEQAGVAQRVYESLSAGGIAYVRYDKVTPEPEPILADEGAKLAKKEGCDLVVGVGGGSSLDVAKAVAMLAINNGRAEDYIGLETVPRPGLPTIMIPTTSGTGSEVTFTAVFTMRAKKKKGGINSRFMYPDLALLDPELTVTLPPNQTAQTGTDALTHAIEAFTSLQSNPLTDLVARQAVALIGANLKRAVENGEDREAREKMLLGSLLGGLALAGAGVGACHALAYPLGAFFDIPHGLANAVLLPYIMEYNMESAQIKYAEVASLMGTATTARSSAEDGVKIVRRLTEDVGIPKGLKALNIPESAVEDMAEMAMTVARPIANNPRKMTTEAAVRIYERAF